MKSKLLSALLLLCCFCLLAIRSGTIPVLAGGDTESVSEMSSPQPETIQPEEDAAAELSYVEEENSEAETENSEAEKSEFSSDQEATYTPTPEPIATAAPTMPDWNLNATIVSTTITSNDMLNNNTDYELDVSSLLASGSSLTLPSEGYQILIIHTHGTEAYTPDGDDIYLATTEYRTTDINYSVVRVGQALADSLSAYGLRVLHDTELYDYPSYNGYYTRSGEAIEEYIAENPGIALVIDLHRDALEDGDTIYKVVTQVEGESAAQIMFVMGTDVNLYHPNWIKNLTLALTLQQAASARYEALMRPTVLCNYRYNQQLTAGSLLIEVGSSGNTLQEAITAVQLFADAIAPILLSMVEE